MNMKEELNIALMEFGGLFVIMDGTIEKHLLSVGNWDTKVVWLIKLFVVYIIYCIKVHHIKPIHFLELGLIHWLSIIHVVHQVQLTCMTAT